MSISATCPGCNKSYQLSDTQSGKKVRCKSCSEIFLVPGQSHASDRDEDEERIQTSTRPAKRAFRDEEDEDLERPPVRRRPLKKRGDSAALPLLIGACIFLGVVVLAVGGVAVWAFVRLRQPPPVPVAANPNPPAPVPQPAQAPPQNQAGMPPFQQPMPAQGPLAAELTNANISGFGAHVEVTADYRFTSGNPAGRRIFLFIKATKAMGFLQKQTYYVVELHSNKTQDTIHATGMTIGIENGPFEMWLGEGSAGMMPPMISARDLTKISNVVTVAAKQNAIPGMPNIPGMPGRPPFGPRGMRR